MKKGIHPEMKDCVVTCACGETFTVKSVKSEMPVEVCSKCHPFYSGKQSRASRAGRVDKFNKKYGFTSKEAAE
ncbi:MAG: 50S ribosomal protein L31 [Bacilli bacterium]|nr:50S ribosomal protein L31 [Bacilli bacterium]